MAPLASILAWGIPWTGEPGARRSPWGRKESDAAKQQQLRIQDMTASTRLDRTGGTSSDIRLVCYAIPLFSRTVDPNYKSDNKNSALFLVWSLDNSCRSNLDKTEEEATFGFLCVPLWGFPSGSDGKESACQGRRRGFDPRVGKIPWRRKWQLAPVFLPVKSQGQRSLVCYSSWAQKDLDMTEVTEHSNILKSLPRAERGHKDTSVTLVYLGRPWHHIWGKQLP